MQLTRPAYAQHPFRFGRGIARQLDPAPPPSGSVSNDLKLFATTFLAGFIFVSLLIG
jgi:hypothetical protein